MKPAFCPAEPISVFKCETNFPFWYKPLFIFLCPINCCVPSDEMYFSEVDGLLYEELWSYVEFCFVAKKISLDRTARRLKRATISMASNLIQGLSNQQLCTFRYRNVQISSQLINFCNIGNLYVTPSMHILFSFSHLINGHLPEFHQ